MMLDAVPARGNRGPPRLHNIALPQSMATVALTMTAALALTMTAAQASLALDGLASPQETVPHQVHPEAREAIGKIRSPYCPGQMLEVCPSWQAAELRDSIDQLAREEGLSADSLVELVIAAHGEEYRALPKGSGTGLLAWVMPPAALLMGLAVVVVVLRRLRGTAAGAGEGLAGDISEEDRERLDAALAELEAMEEME